MSESKTTRGPWEATDLSGRPVNDPSVMSAKHCIATVWINDISQKQAVANARLISAAPDYAHAAGLAITALSFALERAQREGDDLAFAQISEAKQALIEADNKRTGRGQRQMIDVTPRRSAIAKAEATS